ncbi:hypothetical protein PCANC_20325 [Puccinia coronata f. sp. avenae]|uniref:Uncharacterized protein n=1 Tax=Puccinia coronata f. sp. avenae TaxID=200324 RepID=A0A2N5TZK0_9BASI|nr:hypothetical protein PCANC_20325 [Puccinia coronata f. sp. avenae]
MAEKSNPRYNGSDLEDYDFGLNSEWQNRLMDERSKHNPFWIKTMALGLVLNGGRDYSIVMNTTANQSARRWVERLSQKDQAGDNWIILHRVYQWCAIWEKPP